MPTQLQCGMTDRTDNSLNATQNVTQRTALFDELATYFDQRVSATHLDKRLRIEERRNQKFSKPIPWWKQLKSVRFLFRLFLHLTLLRGRGQRNALDLKVEHYEFDQPRAAKAAKPEVQHLRILHLSDFHINAHPDYARVLAERLKDIEADLTLFTGDLRARSFGSNAPALAALESIAEMIPNLGGHCYAALGNHDSITLVPHLEQLGFQCLINESVEFDINNIPIVLSGVDDPSDYRCDDLSACLPDHLQDESARTYLAPRLAILMAHSPELIASAAARGYDIYLTGHLHGGQICWPSGRPIRYKLDLPWEYCSGGWRKNNLQGYTSRGSGTTIVDARFNCPPEVTILTFSANKN